MMLGDPVHSLEFAIRATYFYTLRNSLNRCSTVLRVLGLSCVVLGNARFLSEKESIPLKAKPSQEAGTAQYMGTKLKIT